MDPYTPATILNGVITTNISADPKHCSAQFHVLEGNSGNLLSNTTACQIDLLKVTINSPTYNTPSTNQYPAEFECLFESLALDRQLHIDPNVSPNNNSTGESHVRSDVEKELKRL